MILDELTLENVGTFRGKHSLTLTTTSARPVVLIGGLNGAGKTTVLESVHLALYGALSQPSGRRAGSYETYLRRLIHHGVPDTEGATVQLTFRAYQAGEEHTYRIRRHWRATGASLRESVLVAVDGKHDEALTASWPEHVETFLPRGIAGLFFFDGEQIEALADLERSRQVLSSALAALLGLDLVDRLSTDLAVLRRRHRTAAVPNELRIAVEERKATATALRQAEETCASAVAGARTEAERADKVLNDVTERYRAAGGGLLDQRETAETRVQMYRQQLSELDEQLRQEAADVAPLLQVSALLDGLRQQAHLEDRASRDRIVVDVVKARDEEVLDQLRKANAHASVVKKVARFLADDVATRAKSAEVLDMTGLREPTIVDRLCATALPSTRNHLVTILRRRETLKEDLGQAERTLVAIPDPEALAPLSLELDEASQHATRMHAALTQAEDQLGAMRHERARADAAYETALDKSAHASFVVDDDRRLVEHVDRVRVTLETLKVAATERHLDRISSLVQEALTRLLRKGNLITAVHIDPLTHTVQLTGPGGRVMAANEMSAGERQLLAVALLWGLARAAGQPLPMIIDTPLGRLDGSHRSHLIERYFPHASHQVILLSTDTEIDAAAYSQIRSKVGRAYRLEFDATESATSVVPGYFWER